MKKEWEQPELIVIIRTKLEEDVMAACKTGPGTCNEANHNAHDFAKS
jgi:hypothetical protein